MPRTYSIDHQGNIRHHGDIRRQVIRIGECADALLAEAECDRDNIAEILVYLRDPADYAVEQMFAKACPSTPTLFLHAPVCRPDGWLRWNV